MYCCSTLNTQEIGEKMFGIELTKFDQKVYETELKSFLPRHIIDIHTHISKKEFARKDMDDKGLVKWTKMVAEECTMEDLDATYKALFPNNIVKPVLMGDPTHDLAKTNAYTAACAKKEQLPAFFCVSYQTTADEIRHAITKEGFCGIKPYLNHSPAYIPSNEIRIFDFLPHEHLEVCNELGAIVMLHISRPQRLKDPLNLAQLMEIEKKYPNVKVIVAHIGRAYSKEDLGDAFDTLRHTEKMMFDFTANTLDLAMIECIKAVGPKRFMFGSDLPITKMRMYRITENGIYYNVVPRGLYGDVSDDYHMRETDEKDITTFIYEELLAFKRCAETLNLSAMDIEDIMCNNAAKLFNIDF